jgi:hypothetical protein
VPADAPDVERLLKSVVSWAQSADDVRAVALVGSWARGAARQGSDIDLIVLSRTPDDLVAGTSWIECVDTPNTAVGIQEWGAIRSVRVQYASGLEVEYGIGSLGWAHTSPVDSGTRRVVSDGMVNLYDPDGLVARLEAAAAP